MLDVEVDLVCDLRTVAGSLGGLREVDEGEGGNEQDAHTQALEGCHSEGRI